MIVGLLCGFLASSLKASDLQALSIETLKKQAKGLQDEYMRMRDKMGGVDSDTSDRLKEEIEELEHARNALKVSPPQGTLPP